METILIVMSMMTSPEFPNQDVYIISEPSFSSVEECKEFVYYEADGLAQKAQQEYKGRPVSNFYCVDSDAVKNLTDKMTNGSEPKIAI
tara:strand:- start:8574 stop:8837 length:264 start_codon:yes stop_codon:yes gene_type:complete